MKSKSGKNEFRPHARIVGDLVVIHAEGMRRHQVKALARVCMRVVRDIIDNNHTEHKTVTDAQ